LVKARAGLAATVLGAVASLIGAWLVGAMTVLAATPSPTAATVGDPRSSGQGPGLVGDPALALLVVVAIGVAAVLVTLTYVRLTTPRGG
jgi:hypothetical protein